MVSTTFKQKNDHHVYRTVKSTAVIIPIFLHLLPSAIGHWPLTSTSFSSWHFLTVTTVHLYDYFGPPPMKL